MSSLGSTILRKSYTVGNTFFHRADGRTKFIFFFWISILAYIFHDLIINTFFIVTCLVFVAIAKLKKQIYLTAAVVVIPLMILYSFAWGLPQLGFNKTVLFTFNFFGRHVTFYFEGLAAAYIFPSRIGTTIMAAMLFYLTTKPSEMVSMLMKFRFPYKFVYGVAATFQLIPITVDEVSTIFQAQTSRGMNVEVGLLAKFKNFLAVIVPLTLGTINKVQTRAITLESRGFSAPVKKTILYEIKFKKEDYLLFVGMFIASAILFYLYFVYAPSVGHYMHSPFSNLQYFIGS